MAENDRAIAEAGQWPLTQLVEQAARGDAGAFEQLIRTRIGGLFLTASRVLSNESDARDVVQDVCITAWRELPRLRKPERFDAWLGRILVNHCRSALRRRRRVVIREIHADAFDDKGERRTEFSAKPSGPAAFAEDLVEADAIRRAFSRLSADDRILLVLHHVEERPLAELAVLTGAPVGTVKWRLHAARKALERALEREG